MSMGDLGLFFGENRLWIIILSSLILIPIFKKNCHIKKLNSCFRCVFLLVLFGLSFGLTYNLILININNSIKFTKIFDGTNINIFISLLSSGIIGPIIEELIFRNIVYEKSKRIFKPIIAILCTGLLFIIFNINMVSLLDEKMPLFIITLILIASLFGSIYLYRKNLEGYR